MVCAPGCRWHASNQTTKQLTIIVVGTTTLTTKAIIISVVRAFPTTSFTQIFVVGIKPIQQNSLSICCIKFVCQAADGMRAGCRWPARQAADACNMCYKYLLFDSISYNGDSPLCEIQSHNKHLYHMLQASAAWRACHRQSGAQTSCNKLTHSFVVWI